MRFGCCANLDQIEIVQEAGYDYIELPVTVVRAESPHAEFEEVREIVRSYDIVPEAWNSLLLSDMKVTGPEVDMYRIERYMRTAFERIEELGGEIVVFGGAAARNVPDGFPREEATGQIVEFVTLAGRIAGAHGITIAIEPLNRSLCNIINTLTEGLDIVRAADHPFVKLAVDLHHLQLENESIEHIIDVGAEIVHVHTSDTGGFHPGSGNYPHKEFFDALRTIGYNDRVSVESQWRDFPVESGKALDFLRGLDIEIPC
ncbi:MAG: sugar phosphate isomerase/epimerase family protein [Armatimonadota bacterium]